MSERRPRRMAIALLIAAYVAMCVFLLGGFIWWARGAVPSLLARPEVHAQARALHYGSPQQRMDAARALGRLGEPAVGALVDALSSPDADVRRQALDALAGMGPTAEAALPALRALRDQADGDEQIAFATAVLCILAYPPSGALEEWRSLADSDDPELRAVAAAWVRLAYESDPEAASAVSRGSMSDAEPLVREYALRGLMDAAGPSGADEPDAVRPLLRDPDPTVRSLACVALMHAAPTDPATETAIAALLSDPDPAVAGAAGRQLMADRAPHALEWAERFLESDDKALRESAEIHLARLLPETDLARAARDASLPDNARRMVLARMAKETAPEEYQAVVRELIGDPVPEMRARCLKLFSDSVSPNESVPVILRCLSDPDSRVRATGMSLLRYMGPEAEPARDAVLAGLDDEDASVRWHAVWGVARLGGETASRRDALEALLAREDAEHVRKAIGDALRSLS